MGIRKGFKFERCREIFKQIGDLQGELTQIMSDSDKATAAAAQDDVAGHARDPNGPGLVAGHVKNPPVPAQERRHSVRDAVAAAFAAEKDKPVPMSEAIKGFDRLRASNLRGLMDRVADPSRK